MANLLEPNLRDADELGRAPVATMSEPLVASAGGDRRLGTLIAEASRLQAGADFGLHNPGGVRIDLPGGLVTYADLHRVMPFDNTVVRLTISGAQLRQLAEQAGPRYYYANLRISYTPDPRAPRFGRASLSRLDGTPVEVGQSYSLATNDFLADGGDSLGMLPGLERTNLGVTTLDAVVALLRTMPSPVVVPYPPR
jgi:5'-nucleotidase